MRVDTKFGVVIILTIRAPNSFKMIQIEIIIGQILLKKFHRQLLEAMGKGAVFSILAHAL